MKRIMLTLLLVLITLISCDIEMLGGDESSVNQFIYPYLEFTLLNDGTCSVSVLDGAAVGALRIPAALDGVKVSEFAGFQNPADAVNLERLTIDINTAVAEESLDSAINLKEIIFEGIVDGSVWPELPVLETSDGQHFAGWFAGDKEIHAGMPVDPDNTVVRPVYGAHSLTFVEEKEPTCTEQGKEEHYICSGCRALFRDSEGKEKISEEDIVISPMGHDETGEWETNSEQHWKLCMRCNTEIMLGNHTFSEYEQTQDNVWTRKCTICGYSEFSEHIEHTLSHHEAVEATCTEEGNIEYWKCIICGKYFDAKTASEDDEIQFEDTVIAPTGHTPSNDYMFDKETHWKTCIKCGIKINETEEPHDFEYIFSAEDRNLTVMLECIDCHYIDKSQSVSPTGIFDVAVVYGHINVERKSSATWEIGVDEEYIDKFVSCEWTAGDGSHMIDDPLSFTITFSSDFEENTFFILCNLFDSDGNKTVWYVAVCS